MLSEILRLFVNTSTPDLIGNRENLPQQMQMELSKKPKIISQFFAAFVKPTSNFQHSETNLNFIAELLSSISKKEISLIDYVFPKL